MSNISVNTITDASGGSTASINGLTPQASNMAATFNRIINGAMTIDQRNAGASVTPINGQFSLDRWSCGLTQASKFSVQQNAGSVTPPVGFSNYLGVTSLASYSVLTGDTFYLSHKVEGYNIADLSWGTANAKTITLSFQVYSSLTGTFGGAINNGAGNRSYPFSYTISLANTWTSVSITVAGDTGGSYSATNALGFLVWFGLGSGSAYSGTAGAWVADTKVQPTGSVSVVGTSGATFYITGVQLEAGSSASSFAHENVADTLQKCQRYYWKNAPSSRYAIIAGGNTQSSYISLLVTNPEIMRAAPSFSYSGLRAETGTLGTVVGTYAGVQTSLYQVSLSGGPAVGTVNAISQDQTDGSGYLAALAEL